LSKLDLQIAELEAILKARKSLIGFTKYTMPSYQVQWFHKEVCRILDQMINGDKKKVMIFIPPQHGKSELSSRRFPAYLLGHNPKLKIALCSYGADHAQSFNRDVQRIMTDDYYSKVFPDVRLNESNLAKSSKGTWKRTANIFEVVGHGGFLKTVGVGGALTGTTVDFGIIDDPFKDRAEAESHTYRKRVWNWYTDVFETRLHNDSKQLLLFTRWHEDDLAGKLLERDDDWEVITFRALRENDENKNDPRKIDEALWPEKHNAEKIKKIRETSPRTFASLYQQRPAPLEGSILKRDYFQILKVLPKEVYSVTTHYVVDGAYTKNTDNDPSGILAYKVHQNNIYIVDYVRVWCEFSELIEEINKCVDETGNGSKSKVYIEPKATGLSVYQYLRKHTSISSIKYKMDDGDKVSRLFAVEPILESKRVFLQKAEWNDQFISECLVFPNGKHDEAIDCLTMSINQGLIRGQTKRRVHGYSRSSAPI